MLFKYGLNIFFKAQLIAVKALIPLSIRSYPTGCSEGIIVKHHVGSSLTNKSMTTLTGTLLWPTKTKVGLFGNKKSRWF